MPDQKHILVVEDELIILDTFRRAFASQEAYVIHTVSTVDEALNLIKAIAFDLVFLDMKINGRPHGGMEVLRELARINQQAAILRQIPPSSLVVIMTGSINLQNIMPEAHALGVICFMDKPVVFSQDFIRSCMSKLRMIMMPPKSPE